MYIYYLLLLLYLQLLEFHHFLLMKHHLQVLLKLRFDFVRKFQPELHCLENSFLVFPHQFSFHNQNIPKRPFDAGGVVGTEILTHKNGGGGAESISKRAWDRIHRNGSGKSRQDLRSVGVYLSYHLKITDGMYETGDRGGDAEAQDAPERPRSKAHTEKRNPCAVLKAAQPSQNQKGTEDI